MKVGLMSLLTFVLGSVLTFMSLKQKAPLSSTPPTHKSSPLEVLSSQTGQRWPFQKVILETTGHAVTSFDSMNQIHLEIHQAIQQAAQDTILVMNRDDSPVRSLRRINEASRFFEDHLQKILNEHPDFTCTFPPTRSGKAQRSGYPDLHLIHTPSQTNVFLDPKLFEASGINSSFRTFYYEPRIQTLKVNHSGLHFLLGFSHNGDLTQWKALDFHLVDLSQITLKLKTEFSASNKDLYQSPKQ